MTVIVIQGIGALIFLTASIWLAGRVRRLESRRTAENASRISHALFWFALVLPGAVGLFYPGLKAYDHILGLPSLPSPALWVVAGGILLLVGLVFMVSSNRFLMTKGRGAAAFLLTEHLVTDGVYARTRNPMSFGYYAACVGIGMIAGSLTLTLGALLVIVPVHMFNLKYFEERELELRHGRAYAEYKQQVPFLIPRLRRS